MYMYNKNANLRSESAQTDHRKISQFWAVSHIMGGECTSWVPDEPCSCCCRAGASPGRGTVPLLGVVMLIHECVH